jgi:hypothetical protein
MRISLRRVFPDVLIQHRITQYVLISQNTTILALSSTYSINSIDYMFRPLYWPSSDCIKLIKKLYNMRGVLSNFAGPIFFLYRILSKSEEM